MVCIQGRLCRFNNVAAPRLNRAKNSVKIAIFCLFVKPNSNLNRAIATFCT